MKDWGDEMGEKEKLKEEKQLKTETEEMLERPGRQQLELEETNMYVLFARMFASITKEVEARCGRDGVEAVREGVRQFGLERGKNIADRARQMGHEADLRHYLSCYDMGRSGYFNSEDRVEADEVEQTFDRCIFAETWMSDHTQQWGIHYCELIDPSIACGYDPRMECCHDRHFFKDGQCHFLFKMKDDNE